MSLDDALAFFGPWWGLVILIGGLYGSLLAYGWLPRGQKRKDLYEPWRKQFGPMMRILGPILCLMGIVKLLRH